jgi:hypothetical protein
MTGAGRKKSTGSDRLLQPEKLFPDLLYRLILQVSFPLFGIITAIHITVQ